MCEWNALQSKRYIYLYSEMALACAIVLSLFWSLAHSQTFPYVFFMGQTLVNHSYVDFDHMLQWFWCLRCGDWYFPSGTRLTIIVRVVALKLFLKTMLSHLVVFTACSTSTTTQEERQSMWDCIVTTKVVISLSVGRSLCELSQPTIRFSYLISFVSLPLSEEFHFYRRFDIIRYYSYCAL